MVFRLRKTDCKKENWAEQIFCYGKMKTLPRNYTVKDFRRATRKQTWPETSSSPGLNKLTYWQVYHVEFPHILKVLEVKTAKFLVGDFN